MYAAAGGASLASRQARNRQKQIKKNPVKPPKPIKPVDVKPAMPQSKQFHHLPNNYHRESGLRVIVGHERKLSGNFGQSKTLLPIAEAKHFEENSSKSDTPVHTSVSLPLAETGQYISDVKMVDDGIDLSESLHKPLERQCSVTRNLALDTLQDIDTSPENTSTNPCSDADIIPQSFQTSCQNLASQNPEAATIPTANVQPLPNGHSHPWCHEQPPSYNDLSSRMVLPCGCTFSECAQGKAAWQERGRRCSVTERGDTEAALCHRAKQSEAHRRWMKRNRIHDSSFGGSSSDDEDFLGLYNQSSAANAILYVGLGTVAIGLIIAFVGTGEKGFKTLELRLIGPTLIGCGLLCCLFRILLCVCPSSCVRSRRKRHRKRITNKQDGGEAKAFNEEFVMADHTTSLLTKNSSKKRVSIVIGTQATEALKDIATTSLLLQNESVGGDHVVPPVNKTAIPDLMILDDTAHCSRNTEDLELRAIDSNSLDICSVTSSECSGDNLTVKEADVFKMSQNAAQNMELSKKQKVGDDSLLMETSLVTVTSTASPVPTRNKTNNMNIGELVLSPSKLGQ